MHCCSRHTRHLLLRSPSCAQQYSSGLTAKKQLKQVHQPIARQVDGVLEHKDRLLRRCRVEASPNTRVLGTTLHADEAAAAAARARAQKGKQAAASGDSAAVCGSAVGQLNPDTFNDTEFYEHVRASVCVCVQSNMLTCVLLCVCAHWHLCSYCESLSSGEQQAPKRHRMACVPNDEAQARYAAAASLSQGTSHETPRLTHSLYN